MNQAPRQAIIDIGSNSIRLVVFGGPARAPVVLYNEKIMAGLGRGVVATGRLDPDNEALALRGLARFAALLDLMQPIPVRAVATAAVRDATNGKQFLGKVRKLGIAAQLLDGDGEAVAAGYGVISAWPQADGLVADLGGGSLELVRVAGGEVLDRVSLPLGAMRVASIRAGGPGSLRKAARAMIAPLDWIGECAGKPIYLVGGAWRALARVHMHQRGWPLAVLGNYSFPASEAAPLKASVSAFGSAQLAAVPGVRSSRALQLDDAAALLAALVAVVEPDTIVISAFGLREGLLYQQLDARTRACDPLIDAIRHAVGTQQQAEGYAQALLAWSDPLFADEPPAMRRLRHAVCLLSGAGWAINPDFRATDSEDLALHGNWIGIDAADRATMAMALHVALGGDPAKAPALLGQLASQAQIARATAWGFALRVAQRLSGGGPQALSALPLGLAEDGDILLQVPLRLIALSDPSLERRLARLGAALGRAARIESLPYAPEKAALPGGRSAAPSP
ncbi:MAG TPA: Ppx/GppA family phosphatase [Novosphingobium sp.]|nr:Ppx/GppA family phosphatase [Novosphingobium sp.]